MSVALRELRHRIRSIQQISKVTNAMQSVSAARLDLYGRLVKNTRHYEEKLGLTLRQAGDASPDYEHPLSAPSDKGNITLVIFGADRGLCGSFNSDLFRKTLGFLQDHARDNVNIFVMGKIVNRRLRRRGYSVQRLLHQPSYKEREKTLREICDIIVDAFQKKHASEVHILYSQVLSSLAWRPVIDRLLPFDGNTLTLFDLTNTTDSGRSAPDYFEPRPERIVDQLLPEYLYRYLDLAFLNSLDSETVARQAAMARASKNAKDVLNDLVLLHNRLRQEQITTEMIELAGGGMGEG